jgi:hypothetical protein
MSVEEMIVYYARFLDRNEYWRHLKRFSHRLKADPPAARAEAVVFQVLWSEDLHPDIFEDNSTGGPDFCCKPETDNSFLVEVASLNSAALSARTKLPLRIEGPGGGAYGMITEKLFSVVKTKAAQLGNYAQPRVLAITCEYDFASLLMNRPAAQYALGSQPHFEVPIGGKSKDGVWTWDEKGGNLLVTIEARQCVWTPGFDTALSERIGCPVDFDLSQGISGPGHSSP